MCICRPGFIGDGFSCKSDCVARECQPFSRCIHNIPKGITECVCIEGTILSGTRCHLDIVRSCKDVKEHIVVRSKPITTSELNGATAKSPIKLVTENNTVIEIYPMNGTLSIDGFIAQFETVKFVNGEMYYLSGPLKRTEVSFCCLSDMVYKTKNMCHPMIFIKLSHVVSQHSLLPRIYRTDRR
ncbi:unnamed protein product [Trichobilharzia regenti]|nr:unnamed protein product [Trichobilharzia regenti]